MSKTNYSTEPWKSKENFILSADGIMITKIRGVRTTLAEDRANTERIAQCVNAMAGIEDPGKLRQTFEAVRHLKLDAYHEIKKERDELLDWKAQAEIAYDILLKGYEKLKAEMEALQQVNQ